MSDPLRNYAPSVHAEADRLREENRMLRQQMHEERQARQREAHRPTVARKVDVPGIGPVPEEDLLLLGLALGAAGWFVLGDGDSPVGGSGNPTPRSGEGRQEFMSRCLSATGGDMKLCNRKWKQG